MLECYCESFLYTHVTRKADAGHRHGGDHGVGTGDGEKADTRRGGISTRAEIDALDALGIDAVVGMAIYTGSLAID